MKEQRLIGLDIFRGVALLLMMIYHFTYDLNYFRFISVDINYNPNFLLFRYTIISMFLLSVGVSLALVHQHGIRWSSVRKRLIQLGLASLAVTLATYVVFPNSWVYFGILHFILFASLTVLPLLTFPKTTLLLALSVLIASAMKIIDMNPLFTLLQTPLHLPLHTQDVIPFLPWIGAVLLGMSMVHYKLHLSLFRAKLFTLDSPLHQLLKQIGQHSLLIYLLHQLIFFGGFELYFMLFSK